jgi:hypothetical protein
MDLNRIRRGSDAKMASKFAGAFFSRIQAQIQLGTRLGYRHENGWQQDSARGLDC